MRVIWDRKKDRANRWKHGLGFEEVRALFEGEVDFLVIYDQTHSDDEDRFVAIGPIARGIVIVAYSEPAEDVVRIISARLAVPRERRLFRQWATGRKP